MPRKEKLDRIPRPPNPFILYRSEMGPRLPPPSPPGTRRTQAENSQIIGTLWRNEHPAVKAEFQRRAALKKMEHEAMHPDYRYKPRSKAEKEVEKEAAKELKALAKAQKAKIRDQPRASTSAAGSTAHPLGVGQSLSTSTASCQNAPHNAYYAAQQYNASFDAVHGHQPDAWHQQSYSDFEYTLDDVSGTTASSNDFYQQQALLGGPSMPRPWDLYYDHSVDFAAYQAAFDDRQAVNGGCGTWDMF
ncbi:hypothetical protein FPV67DRAFT_585405 [Lyophyllum atratum]|nr:hypothetical protein FPV67DRAFT_585405 [Lyophyllum atratum]